MKDKILVTRPYLPPREEYDRMLNAIWERHWLTNNGPLEERLEGELRHYLGVENMTLQTNGHLSLEAAIQGLKLSGEIITTPFTFASTTHAITRCGATPVFCDVKPDDLTIDPEQIESLITEKTTAILAVHVYGFPCDVDRIKDIAQRHGIKVIYDGAHAFGVRFRGKSLLSYGDVCMCSFHATKLYHTIEGGALVYADPELRSVFEGLRNFGIRDEILVDMPGGNAKMNEMQAAMGLVNLSHIDELIAERKHITEAYRSGLADVPGLCFFTPESTELTYNYAYFPVLIDEKRFGQTRDALYEALKAWNIFSRRYFYPLTCDYECYRAFCPREGQLPVARLAASRVLALPIYNGLDPDAVTYVCDAIRAIQSGVTPTLDPHS